eukprot:209871_1
MKITAKYTIIGSLCVTAACVFGGVEEVITKASKLTLAQLLMGRFFVVFILSVLWWNIKKPTTPNIFNVKANGTTVTINHWYGDSPYVVNIWARATVYGLHIICFYSGLKLVPIGDLQCILYISPLLTVYVGCIVLKETLPVWYIITPSTILTILGVLITTQPPFLLGTIVSNKTNNYMYEPLNVYGLVLIFLASVSWTIVVLLVRTAKDTHFLQLEIASSLCLIFVIFPCALIINHYVVNIDFFGDLSIDGWYFDFSSILSMIIVGFCGFGFIAFSVIGYQLGEATYVSWLECIYIPISFIYQSVVFDDKPNVYELIGSVLVILGCTLPLMRQIYIHITERNSIRYEITEGNSSSDDRE